MRKSLFLIAISATLAACAVQRAQVASDAKAQMVGMKKEQVLACMGPPANRATEGATEVWSYSSGNDHTVTSATAWGDRSGATAIGTSSRRFCTVNVVMSRGEVAAINYVGPTGGLLTAGEQCAFALQNCVNSQ